MGQPTPFSLVDLAIAEGVRHGLGADRVLEQLARLQFQSARNVKSLADISDEMREPFGYEHSVEQRVRSALPTP